MKAYLIWFLALTCPVLAQPSGPVLRPLGHNYYLVQCNAVMLQPDDTVTILRQGQEVGSGKVMRCENSMCSILMTSGEARRLDLVVLNQRTAVPGDRGPTLPVYGAAAPSKTPPVTVAAKRPDTGYFGSMTTLGGVYNLNTGEYLTKP